MAMTAAQRTEIIQTVVGMFGAAPGATYLAELSAYAGNVQGLVTDLTGTSAFKSLYPTFLTNEEFATNFLNNLLGTAVTDTAAKDWAKGWMKGMLDAGKSRGDVIYEALTALKAIPTTDATWGAAAQQFANKVTVAEYYSVTMAAAVTDLASLQSVLANVTASTDVSNPAQVIGSTPGAQTGQTFTLTTSIDVLTGTSGNDTFIGDNSGTTATVTSGDQLTGGGGDDTFKYYLKSGASVTMPTLSGIETIFVSGNDTSNIDVSGLADVNHLVIDKPGASKTYTLGASDKFTLQNDNGTTLYGANVVLASGETSATVLFDTVGTNSTTLSPVDVKGSSLATVNITATGKNYVQLNNSAGATSVKTVNVDGSGSLFLDTDTNGMTGITTINASSNTGGVIVDVAASKLTFTGGSGNDEVRFDATEFTADDKLTGGPGTDVIQVKDTAITSSTSDVVKGINASSGFETLSLATASASVDFDVITSGLTNVRVDAGAGTYSFTNATNSTKVEISAGITIGANNFDIANKLGQTTTNLKMDATSSGASSVQQLKLTGVNTINIESDFSGSGSQSTANTVTLTAQSDNTTFNVSGDHALTLTLLNAATTTGSTVNASSMTAALTVTATDKADSITGGSGKDTITGDAGVDTVTGGSGADKFVFSTVDIDTTAGAVTDVITDFVSGSDSINHTVGGAGSATNYTENLTAASSLSALLTAADTALNGTVKYYFGVVGSDGYLVFDADGTGYTDVIKLTGVTDMAYTDLV